jgi:hypothetical protein
VPYEGNTSDGRHYWLTPPALMAELQTEFDFDFDPCPYPRPDEFDGLTAEWGRSNYVNPPFKGPTAWVRKSIAEAKKGKRVVFVFPVDKWVLLLLEAGATVRLRLPDWEKSLGVAHEIELAAFIGLPVDHYEVEFGEFVRVSS